MAASQQTDAQKPEVGDILLVIHNFQARSSDELSLNKGDRVELIERDDEFGDGWYLGRHMTNGNTGLFPEVYTRPAPKSKPTSTQAAPLHYKTPLDLPTSSTDSTNSDLAEAPSSSGADLEEGDRSATPLAKPILQPPPDPEPAPVTLPLNSTKPDIKPPISLSTISSNTPSASPTGTLGRHHGHNQDNPVLHETLTVIDEHITDLHSAPSNGNLNGATDSGSEYSSQMPDRLSYIQGEETDEEDEMTHTREEVETWSATDVAEYLFTVGVERKHCEVFQDQEITGEVLLGMDQSTLFLKAFDLGSVGRRLKTWQRIKSLQDEVNGQFGMARRSTRLSDAGSEDSKHGRVRSRTNTITSSSMRGRRLSSTPKLDPITPLTPVSPIQDGSSRASHSNRPSAASIREFNHARRHSSTDYRLNGSQSMSTATPRLASSGTFPLAENAHKKQPSFDRNWTMGGANPRHSRPLSSTGLQDILGASDPDMVEQAQADLDRGYFSGTEIDGRKRNVLKKRDSLAAHSRNSSYTEKQRLRAATSLSRHSRFGSVDSVNQDAAPPSASHKFFSGERRRTASAATAESVGPPPPMKDYPPTVTKLDAQSTTSSGSRAPEWLSKTAAQTAHLGGSLRAISDSMSRSNDRSKLGSPTDSSVRDSPRSSTPSGGPSLELDADSKNALANSNAAKGKSGKKTKKETSAYLRGLQKVPPRESIQGSDYSGWMKKKSSNLMTTWKPRLFVLKGRRLSYYYSEDDTEEKGLIDISFHRVLPADNERLTGLHATLTGASNTPIKPTDSSLSPQSEGDEALAAAMEKGNDAMFIFKLVPPRAGLTKAVNFTKPTVHYFAVPNIHQGRMWMAALMKATIDRDESLPMTSTYQQQTISLAKAKAMRHRPPALMNAEERLNDEKNDGLGITVGEVDSAVSGLEKMGLQSADGLTTKKTELEGDDQEPTLNPQSA